MVYWYPIKQTTVWLSRFCILFSSSSSLFSNSNNNCGNVAVFVVCRIVKMGALARTKWITDIDTTNQNASCLCVNARFRYISSNIYALFVKHLHELSYNNRKKKNPSREFHSIKRTLIAIGLCVRIAIDPFRLIEIGFDFIHFE